MRDAVIVDAVRTPIGRRGGALSEVHPVDLSAHVLRALAERTGLDPASVDDVQWGCVSQVGAQAGIVSRSAVFAAGWPVSVPATTINRACGSSQQAVSFAAGSVIADQADVVIAGGVESMSLVPMGSAVKNPGENYPRGARTVRCRRIQPGHRRRDDRREVELLPHPTRRILAPLPRTLRGRDRCRCVREADRSDRGSEHRRRHPPRRQLESLGKLKTVFKEDGVIHAGNSSQISDGAGALLITTSEYAAQQGWTPLARIHTAVVAADDPVVMLTGPIAATEKALAKSGLSIDDIGAFEINEAFAPVPLAWLAETGAKLDRLNPLGGAIGVGHPLGGSGAILMTRLVHHMRDNGIRYGLQSMCEAGGMANATILELL